VDASFAKHPQASRVALASARLGRCAQELFISLEAAA
jgi:hypothetical protein